MISILGAVLTIAAFSAVGFGAAAEKRRRVRVAEGFAALVEHISARLPSLAVMDDIVMGFDNTALRASGVLKLLQAQNSYTPCNKRLLCAIELQRDDTELYRLLLPMATELGSTDYGRQKHSLETVAAQLNALCAARRAGLENSEKCYRWLGVLAGVTAVILLI